MLDLSSARPERGSTRWPADCMVSIYALVVSPYHDFFLDGPPGILGGVLKSNIVPMEIRADLCLHQLLWRLCPVLSSEDGLTLDIITGGYALAVSLSNLTKLKVIRKSV